MISDELRIITVFLCSYFGAVFVLPKLAHIARRIGLIDQPNSRKVHVTPRPLVGGIGMVIAATFSSLAFIPIAGLRGFFLGLSVLLLIGFLDDFREIGHKQKFLAQIGATLLLIYLSNVKLTSFGDLVGIGELVIPGGVVVCWAVTVFCIVGVINSINLIDGLDGLAGGISFVAFMIFAVHASIGGNIPLMLLNFALAGAVLGFLRFNWYPSTLFMGDAGSLSLGFCLGFMALALTQGEGAVMSPVAALLILAVPITDTLVIMCKRVLKGVSPFKPDKYHLHHIFMRYGLGRAGAVRAIIGLSFLMGLTSFVEPTYKLGETSLFGIYIFYFTVYLLLSFHIPQIIRLTYRFRSKKQKQGEADKLLAVLLGAVDKMCVFRKSKRYNVYLKCACESTRGNEIFEGKVLDLSLSGCMVYLKGLTELKSDMVMKISIPNIMGITQEIEVPVEHIWASEQRNIVYHGFRFETVSEHAQQVMAQFFTLLERKSTVKLPLPKPSPEASELKN